MIKVFACVVVMMKRGRSPARVLALQIIMIIAITIAINEPASQILKLMIITLLIIINVVMTISILMTIDMEKKIDIAIRVFSDSGNTFR